MMNEFSRASTLSFHPWNSPIAISVDGGFSVGGGSSADVSGGGGVSFAGFSSAGGGPGAAPSSGARAPVAPSSDSVEITNGIALRTARLVLISTTPLSVDTRLGLGSAARGSLVAAGPRRTESHGAGRAVHEPANDFAGPPPVVLHADAL